MAKPIKHKISWYKYSRILSLCETSHSRCIKKDRLVTHVAYAHHYNGFAYVKVYDLTKPVKFNENPSYYRYDVAQAIIGGK